MILLTTTNPTVRLFPGIIPPKFFGAAALKFIQEKRYEIR